MKKIISILILLLFVVGCSKKTPQNEAAQLFDEAVQLTEEYKLEEAREKFIELSELEPNSPNGYFGLGLIYEKQFLLYDALEVYMTIKNSRPTFIPALDGCWRLYNYMGLEDEALQLAVAYNEVLPEQPESKIMLAKIFINSSTPIRAVGFLDTSLTMGVDQDIHDLVKAQYYISIHKPDSAELYYQSGISNPNLKSEALMEAAYYLEKKGLVDSAIVMSRRAINTSNNYSYWFEHYNLAVRNDYIDEACKVVEMMKDAGFPNEAIVTLETLYHFAAKHYTPARHNLDKMVTYSQNTMSYRMYQMEIRGYYGDEMTLMQDYEVILNNLKVNKSEPEFSDLMTYLSTMFYTDVMKDVTGILRLEQVSTKYFSKADYYLRIAYAYYQTGQQDEFESRIRNVLKTHKRHTNWLTGLADIYSSIYLRQYEDAGKLYSNTLEIDKWYIPAFEGYVNMYLELDDAKKALNLFKKYPHFEENYPELAVLKSYCLIRNNQTKEGMDLFVDKIKYLKEDLGWFEKVVKALYHTGSSEDKNRLAKWLSVNVPNNINALILASDIYCNTKNYNEASKTVELAVGLDPENMKASAMNARVMYYLGNADEAIKIMKENNKKNPLHIENNMYLSRIMAIEGIEPNTAENIARKAVFDSQSAFEAWLNLSIVYYNTGRFDLSRGEASKIINSHKNNPLYPEALFQCGMAMYMEGKEEAAEKLQEAIDLGLKGKSLSTAKETLKKL